MAGQSQDTDFPSFLEQDDRYMYILLDTADYEDGYTYGWTSIS